MRYSSLIKSVYGDKPTRSYNRTICMAEGVVTIDGEPTEFKSLEEAKQFVKSKYIAEKLEQQITEEQYETISSNTVAKIIREYHNIRVTDKLIESYIELASSNLFSIDPVVYKIRQLNKLDTIVEGRVHYKLNDSNVVVISEHLQSKLNNLLQGKDDIVEYMRESKSNFMSVIEKIEE